VPRSSAAEFAPFVQLVAEDRRYKIEAYYFVGAGLEYAQKALAPRGRKQRRSSNPQPIHHVTGQQLCWALRQFAHEQFGLLARLVLAGWGIRSTSDYGEIVYNLIRIGKMSKSETDRREDFDEVYDFEQALVKDYSIRHEQEEPCRR